MNPIINPAYLETFLEFRTKYFEEIYSRDTLAHLQEVLVGSGGHIHSYCRTESPGDYSSRPSFDDIDLEIVENATRECLITGNSLVLPKGLQWRYEFTLFFVILFSKYGEELNNLGEFQRIVWQLLGFPPDTLNYRNWNKLCSGSGWNTNMLYQALDAISIGSWTDFDYEDFYGVERRWNWMTFVLYDEASIVEFALKVPRGISLEGMSFDGGRWRFLSDSGTKLMAQLCEIIRLEVSMNPIKSLNYPTGA